MKTKKKGWDPEKDPLPDEVMKEWKKARIAEAIRNKLGIPRPIISAEFKGKRHVAVGSHMFWGEWKTFIDFLESYMKMTLGKDWGAAELKKSPEQMHPIMQWRVQSDKFLKKQKLNEDGFYEGVPTGPFAALLLLAYDLYIVGHNNKIQKELLRRLKNRDQFQGARHELFTAATCIKAGFDLQFEDETDTSRTHVEFIGQHKLTGQKVCVEAKSKHRRGVLGYRGTMRDEQVKLRLRRLLNSALSKDHDHPLVVFVDLNIPPEQAQNIFGMPLSNGFKEICNNIKKASDGKDIFNLLVLTNHPHHYGESDEPDPRRDRAAILATNPEIYPKFPQTLVNIFDAANQYGRVPQFFPKDTTVDSAEPL